MFSLFLIDLWILVERERERESERERERVTLFATRFIQDLRFYLFTTSGYDQFSKKSKFIQ